MEIIPQGKKIWRIWRFFLKSIKFPRQKHFSSPAKLNFHEYFLHGKANFIIYNSISFGVVWVWNIHTNQLMIQTNPIFYFQVIVKRMLEKIKECYTILVFKEIKTNIFIQKHKRNISKNEHSLI